MHREGMHRSAPRTASERKANPVQFQYWTGFKPPDYAEGIVEVIDMRRKPYGMICPITRACELLEPRWTIAIIVSMWAGASKFNEIRREIGSISPSILSKRLKDLEELGLVERLDDPATGAVDYVRTPMALALEPALAALSDWAQQNVDAELALRTTTASNVMWKIRAHFDTDALPQRRIVMRFHFDDKDLKFNTYWVLCNPGAPVEICSSIPDYDVDLYVDTNVKSLSAIMVGRSSFAREIELSRLYMSGDPVLERSTDQWFLKGWCSQRLDDIKQLPEPMMEKAVSTA